MTLAQLCRTAVHAVGPHGYHELPEDTRRKFEAWWSAQVSPRPAPFSPRRPPSPPLKTTRSPGVNPQPEHVHPAMQTVQSQYPTQKTRMRTSFDPELELPKLQRWFSENQHPSRQQIQQYVRELNNLESRRGRKPLDVNNVVYWFKNARAAQKRAEQRNLGGMPCHMSVNGFNSRSHSPTNGSLIMANDYLSMEHNSMKSPVQLGGSPGRYPMSVVSEDNMSAAGSDLEDDTIDPDDRPESPEAPLSLITNKKGRDTEDIPRESPKPPDIIKIHDIKQEPRDLSKPDDRDHSPRQSPIKNSDSCSNHNNNNNSNNNNNEDENGVTVDDNMSDDDSEVSGAPDMRRGSSDHLPHYRPGSPHTPLDRLPFPMVANPMFGHGIMYMSHYIPGLAGVGGVGGGDTPGASGLNLALAAGASDERRKRNRTFIDPVSEVPVLEQWFSMNTHPSHNLILKYTEELNRMPYRQKFPRLESKNVQFWFKNRRAKCKRLKMSLYEPPSPGSLAHYHPGERKLT